MPEQVLGLLVAAALGWGGFCWKRADHAVDVAMKAGDQVDRLEIKVAERYLAKQEFESYMDRLFDTLAEVKSSMHYLTERVDFHVSEQASESQRLRDEIERLRHETRNNRTRD